MSTWAIVTEGRAYEVVTGDTAAAALAGKRADAWIAANLVSYRQVPDTDTNGAPLEHGAVDNGNGTFTNPPPIAAPPAPLSVTDFKKRFTFAEKTALFGSADVGVKVFLDELNTAGIVHLDDPETVAGLAYIVSLGLITAERRDQILAP